MLVTLVVITLALVSAQSFLADTQTVEQTTVEKSLKGTLGDIRQSLDMAFAVHGAQPGSWPVWLATDVPVASILQGLEARGFLSRATPADPTVPGHRWGQGTGDYWMLTANLVHNQSFENASDAAFITGAVSPDPTRVGAWMPHSGASVTLVGEYPSRDTTDHDDYSGQNKYGSLLGTDGRALRIAR